jgi:hypothetical protein
METISVDYGGIPLEVSGKVNHIDEFHWTIVTVKGSDIDIIDLLSQKQLDEIDELVNEKFYE